MSGESDTVLSHGATTGVYHYSAIDGIVEALMGNVQQGKEIAAERTEEAVEATKSGATNAVLGRSRGVLAGVVNSVDSGALVISVISAMQNIGASQNIILIIFILAALLLSTLVWFFLINMYKAVSRRIFWKAVFMKRYLFSDFLCFFA